ncbi:MAG: 3'-5' exonuclease [Dehalococcoidia bacterium]|nr:3'-5' exonuclease [Dehalococcoidia bacterium]
MYVALDIETTGLDPENDHVTEIGMVRFDDAGAELESFHTFVNPGRSIPLFVQQLTGVTDEEVRSAPSLQSLAPRVRDFVGENPVVGHNIGFDRSYLRRGGIDFAGPSIDTAEFARLIFPSRRGRGLADIACELGMTHDDHHRALADARMARDVFLGLRARFDSLDSPQRAQLARLLSFHNEALASILAPDAEPAGPANPGPPAATPVAAP